MKLQHRNDERHEWQNSEKSGDAQEQSAFVGKIVQLLDKFVTHNQGCPQVTMLAKPMDMVFSRLPASTDTLENQGEYLNQTQILIILSQSHFLA